MKAIDTIVALDTKYGKRNPDLEKIQQAQAEISFKAGEDQGYRNGYIDGYNTAKQEAIETHFEGLVAGRKAGIREVVEWVIKEKDIPVRYEHNSTCYDCIERLKLKYIGKPNSRNGGFK